MECTFFVDFFFLLKFIISVLFDEFYLKKKSLIDDHASNDAIRCSLSSIYVCSGYNKIEKRNVFLISECPFSSCCYVRAVSEVIYLYTILIADMHLICGNYYRTMCYLLHLIWIFNMNYRISLYLFLHLFITHSATPFHHLARKTILSRFFFRRKESGLLLWNVYYINPSVIKW